MKIALAGFGTEGKASYEYWNRDGNEITIASEQELSGVPSGVTTITGVDAFARLADFDLIIRSPSINPKKLPYPGKVWSATNEFFEKCPATIIGVTGTKGKGTTSSLIASILRAAGKNVHLVGNIGVPAIGELVSIEQNDIVVFELSSFQLWDAKYSPDTAVILGIEPDHLDVHDSMDDYVAAKANIVAHQLAGQDTYYNPNSELSRYIAEASFRVNGPDIDENPDIWPYISQDGVHVADGYFYSGHIKLCATSFLKLPGHHNIENACAAISASLDIIGASGNKDIFERGLSDFSGLPHRLKFVAEKNGVKYYDDSIATTPGSAIAALSSFNEPKILILGGHDKGGDYGELIELCNKTSSTVIAIGANGDTIERMCLKQDVPCVREAGDMKAIVARAHDTASEGSIVILSPAAASFDMFKSYSDRGEQFVAAVNDLDS